ncbi:ATP-dependent serine protease [Burkholderia ambifaria]|uniref:ATP-dependent serine protease n=1 Tax=Burkholderia ambifaria TaxID=152480 RepID=UPI00158901A5|nr:ATP-dependent serine protease [Burkholderia ambifaria]
MQVLLNRKVRTRDTLRGALSLRAEPHGAVSQRCRECGFLAFRASEQCPVCGVGDWPFTPLRDRRGDAQAAPSDGTQRPVPAWSSRVAAAVRSAAIRRPRASSAPLLSILTVVLMVGGYVTFDRTCRADPVCRGPAAPGATTIDAGAHGADAPTLPVVPVPVYAFHRSDDKPVAAHETPVAADDTQIAAEQPRVADTGRRATARSTARATTTLARHAPPVREPQHARNGVRVADWKGVPARRTHAIHRVSVHTRHGRRAAATEIQLAGVYRGH